MPHSKCFKSQVSTVNLPLHCLEWPKNRLSTNIIFFIQYARIQETGRNISKINRNIYSYN